MRLRRRITLSAAALVACSSLALPAVAHADSGGVPDDPHCTDVSAPASFTVGTFSKTPVLSVAEKEGFLAAQNLQVGYYTVKSSTDQFTQLRDGATPLILTAADNVANYRLNTSNALGHTMPITSIVGLDGGYNLQLFTQPTIPTIESLRGKVLGVDATNSGFAYVAYDILAQHGLAAPTKGADGGYTSTDYRIAAIGGVGGRYLNMTGKIAGATPVDATLLNQGFDILGVHAGLTGTDDVRSVTSPYLSGVVAGQDSWLQANHCTAVRFARALAKAAAYTTDPANRTEVIADIKADEPTRFVTPDFADRYAQAMYDVTMTPGVGQFPTVEVPRDGLHDVLALRAKYDGFDTPQDVDFLSTPAGGLYDPSVVRDALHDAPARG